MRETFLGADRVDRLRLGIEHHAELALVEVADGLPQAWDAAALRVAVVARFLGRLLQLLDRERVRGKIGVAEAHVDHVLARPAQLELERVGVGEDIGRQVDDPPEFERRLRLHALEA